MPTKNGAGIPYFDVIWATSGIVAPVPDAAQGDGSVSYTAGWTTPYSLPSDEEDYLPVPLNQSNGYMNDITTLLQYIGQNGAPPFITTAMNGGTPYSYNLGAICSYNAGSGLQNWVSSAAANTTVPGASEASWVALPFGLTLTADATYYVSGTGSDSTGNGTSGAPWATIQHAVNYLVQNINAAGFGITIQLADNVSPYASASLSSPIIGLAPGGLTINGNSGTPDNVVVVSINANGAGVGCAVQNFKIAGSSGNSMTANYGGQITIGAGMDFGACTGNQVEASNDGIIIINSSAYKISGGGTGHWSSTTGIIFNASTPTITLTGTPNFSTCFAFSTDNGTLNLGPNINFSGAATGQQFVASQCGVINTGGADADYLPGDSPGSGTNPGVSPYGIYV